MKLQGYELPARALAAALTHAAKDDVREYLNGVMLDFKKGRVIGTDGHRMFIGQIPTADFETVVVPRELAEKAVKAAKQELRHGYALALSINDGRAITIISVFGGVTVSADRVEVGRLMEYERVVSLNPSHDPAQFNLGYLADTRKALAIYSGKDKSRCWPNVAPNGGSAALVTDSGVTAFCIVMPVRMAGEGDPCEWFNAKPEAAKAA